jgi:parallel beta-helix repeat protein
MIVSILLASAYAASQGVNVSVSVSLEARLAALETELNVTKGLLTYEVNSSLSGLQKTTNYIISMVDSYACLQNGTDGKLQYYNTNLSKTISFALGNSTAGGVTLVKGPGVLTFDSQILIPYDNIGLSFLNCNFTLAPSVAATDFSCFYAANKKNLYFDFENSWLDFNIAGQTPSSSSNIVNGIELVNCSHISIRTFQGTGFGSSKCAGFGLSFINSTSIEVGTAKVYDTGSDAVTFQSCREVIVGNIYADGYGKVDLLGGALVIFNYNSGTLSEDFNVNSVMGVNGAIAARVCADSGETRNVNLGQVTAVSNSWAALSLDSINSAGHQLHSVYVGSVVAQNILGTPVLIHGTNNTDDVYDITVNSISVKDVTGIEPGVYVWMAHNVQIGRISVSDFNGTAGVFVSDAYNVMVSQISAVNGTVACRISADWLPSCDHVSVGDVICSNVTSGVAITSIDNATSVVHDVQVGSVTVDNVTGPLGNYLVVIGGIKADNVYDVNIGEIVGHNTASDYGIFIYNSTRINVNYVFVDYSAKDGLNVESCTNVAINNIDVFYSNTSGITVSNSLFTSVGTNRILDDRTPCQNSYAIREIGTSDYNTFKIGNLTGAWLISPYATVGSHTIIFNWTSPIGPAGPAGTVGGLPYTYLVFGNVTATYMVNGTTGVIDFSSTNASQVINFALGNLTSGRTWEETILLKGNFAIDSSLTAFSNHTKLELDGTITLKKVANCEMVSFSNKGWITFEGGTWDGNETGQTSNVDIFYIGHSSYIVIKDTVQLAGIRYGVDLYGGSRNAVINNRINATSIMVQEESYDDIEGNFLENGGGIYLYSNSVYGTTVEGCTVIGNTIRNVDSDGISLYAQDSTAIVEHCTVSGNTIIDPSTDGMHNGVKVGYSGAPAGQTRFNTITGNTIAESGGGNYAYGIIVYENSHDNTIVGNTFENLYNSALEIDGYRNKVDSNMISTIRESGHFGIRVNGANNTISSNTIYNTPNYAILISDAGNGSFNLIDGNRLDTVTKGIGCDAACAKNVIINNYIIGCTDSTEINIVGGTSVKHNNWEDEDGWVT